MVYNTAEGPNIAFVVVRAILPYFRARVEGFADLGEVALPILLGELGHIEIPNLEIPIFDKNIFRLNIPVKNGSIMKISDTMNQGYQCLPYFDFEEFLFFLLFDLNEVAEIPLVSELHYNAK